MGENVIYPGKKWLQYRNPEDAGFSTHILKEAFNYYKKIGTDALLVIYDGAVLVSWGDVERRFLCHSLRKSLLSAIIGIYEGKGKIKLNKSLKELDIDDIPYLTESEKKARVIDLLKSRSGVYLPAQYEDNTTKPKRGSRLPGGYFHYNNWDFNVLNTIFEKETGKRFFKDFKFRIAVPLQMEEFRLSDCYYHLEYRNSIHAAYPLRMSAKDLARFGLLYLRNGKWKNKQIIPESWVKKSVKPYSNDGGLTGAFGFMWFVSQDKFKKFNMFSALGNGGQSVSVIPKEKLVFVHRVDTYKWKNINEKERLHLLDKVLNAKIGKSVKNPELKELGKTMQNIKWQWSESFNSLVNRYTFNNELWEIRKVNGKLFLINQFGDKYKMIPDGKDKFVLEDSKRKIKVEHTSNKDSFKIIVYRHPEKNAVLSPV